MPNVMLDAVGLHPMIETPWLGGTTHDPTTSMIN